jgi:hemerythrin
MPGVPVIDEQHQELVSMFNLLTEAVKNNAPRKDIYRLIDDVISYSSLHFATEEMLMAEFGYPEIEAHKQKHRQLIQEALHLRRKLELAGEEQFLEWFHHWPFANILAHIQYADNQVKDHITQGGAEE